MDKIKKNQFLILMSLSFALLGAIYAFPLRASSSACAGELLNLQTQQGLLQGYASRGEALPNDQRITSAREVGTAYMTRLSEALQFLREREANALPGREDVCVVNNVRLFPGVRPGEDAYRSDFKSYYEAAVQAVNGAIRAGNVPLFDAIGVVSQDRLRGMATPEGTAWFSCIAGAEPTAGGQADLTAFSFETWRANVYPKDDEIPALQWKFWIQKELVGAFRDALVRRLVSIRFDDGSEGAGNGDRRTGRDPQAVSRDYDETMSLTIEVQIFFRDVPRLAREVLLCRRNFLIRGIEVHSLLTQAARDAVRGSGKDAQWDSPVSVKMWIEDIHYRWTPEKEPGAQPPPPQGPVPQ